MAPLIVLAAATLLARLAGRLGVAPLRDRAAATTLIVFLLAVLPANIHAAQSGVTIGGAAATPLVPRIALQLLFIALLWWSAVRAPGRERAAERRRA